MKGVIIVNAYYDTPATRYQSSRIREELSKLGVGAEIVKNDFFGARTDKTPPFSDCDFAVYLDKDKYLALALENAGLRLFNRLYAIEACDDKAITSLILSRAGIPIPATIPGLLCYDSKYPLIKESVDYIENALGYPLVAKKCFGSLGKFVYKIDDRAALERAAKELKCTPHLFQKYISESAGTDIRVIVIGGRAVAAMKRVSRGDFRSNIGLGGRGEKYPLDGQLKDVCERAADLLKLDYCGVDVLMGKDGYLICEVNSNAFFGGAEETTGINIASLYSKYIIKFTKI